MECVGEFNNLILSIQWLIANLWVEINERANEAVDRVVV